MINRRDMLKLSGGVAAASGLSACLAPSATHEGPPNILMILTDDHAAYTIGAHGGKLAEVNPTPTLDKLARAGTLITHSLSHDALNAAIFGGQFGALGVPCADHADRNALALSMQETGYETAMIGLWDQQDEAAGFDFSLLQNDPAQWTNPSFVMQEGRKGQRRDLQMVGHTADCMTDGALAWLSHRENDRPFFMLHHGKAPSDLFEYAPRYSSYLGDTALPQVTDLHDAYRLSRDTAQYDLAYMQAAYQACMAAYLRNVKGVDDNLARLLRGLGESGARDNTLIIYASARSVSSPAPETSARQWLGEGEVAMPLILCDQRPIQPPSTSNVAPCT